MSIHNFRNISFVQVEPSPDFNFIIGNNGSGKTSFLEAIYTLGHGRAFRHNQSARIIQHDKAEFILFSKTASPHHQIHTLGLSKARNGENKIKIDGSEGYKLTDLAKLTPIQLITPEGFELLIGGPKYRRAYIDWGCFHHYSEFISLWNKLKRLIKQRNALLKNAKKYQDLTYWDKELIPTAQKIHLIRQEYLKNIIPNIVSTTEEFLPEYQLQCQYIAGWETSEALFELLEKNFERDKQLNYTSLGPHKADLKFKINNIPVEAYLSRGQLKLLMCSLRLAQGEFYTLQTKQKCLYLIDDFTSELDSTKQTLLAKRLKQANSQVFITALSKEQINTLIDENDKIFTIKSGIILG